MPTATAPTTNSADNVSTRVIRPITVAVLHERPTGFTEHLGAEITIGDSLYDPNTGVHVVTDLAKPSYQTTFGFRRATGDSGNWRNAIFDQHTYLVHFGTAREQS